MKTNIGRLFLEDPSRFDVVLEQFAQACALKRAGTSDEIANLACFLASDDAANMTGSIVVSDSGLLVAGIARQE